MKVLKWICIVALILFFAGVILFFVAFAASGFDFKNISGVVVEPREYTESEGKDISVIALGFDNADIEVVFADVDSISVSYPALFTKSGKPASDIRISDSGGKLAISSKMIWYRCFGLFGADYNVKVSVPRDRVCDFEIESDNGEVKFAGGGGVAAGKIFVKSDNGRVDTSAIELTVASDVYVESDNAAITLGKINARKLTVESDNGSVTLSSSEVSEKLIVDSSNGRVTLNGSLVAGAVDIESNNGKVALNANLKADRVDIKSDNGRLDLAGGVIDAINIHLESDNGDISAKLLGKNVDYRVTLDIDNGDSNIGTNLSGSRHLSVEADNGDVIINFTE